MVAGQLRHMDKKTCIHTHTHTQRVAMQFLLPATCKHHLWTLARLSRGDGLVPHKPWPGAKSWRGHGICALKGWRRLKSTAHILRVFFFLGRQRERPCTEEAPRSRLRLPASWACNQTSCARLSTSCRSRSSRATIRCPIWPCTDQGSYCYEPWNSCTANGSALLLLLMRGHAPPPPPPPTHGGAIFGSRASNEAAL